jgi:hypothetical protein
MTLHTLGFRLAGSFDAVLQAGSGRNRLLFLLFGCCRKVMGGFQTTRGLNCQHYCDIIIDNIRGILPFLLRSEAAGYLLNCPTGMTASGKGPFRWLSLKKLHLTPPHFWQTLD